MGTLRKYPSRYMAEKESPQEEPKLAIIRIQNMVIPFPPLAEQKRIVAKLEELLSLCEKLR